MRRICAAALFLCLASALDMIIQLERLQDGSRRVTSITEVGRMESEVITLSELFKFKVDHVQPDRTVVGSLHSTGLRPTFLDKFERHGIALPLSLFTNGRAPMPEFTRGVEA